MATLRIYSDGACSGNQNSENTGGWGAILEFGSARKEIWGGERNTTNNRMELTAVIEAFRRLTRDDLDVEVYTDSSYVANCFRAQWYVNWRRNGWRTKNRKEVENQDLWQELLPLVEKHRTRFFLVKGHISPKTGDARIDSLYKAFVAKNGSCSREDFLYITEQNNRADALANLGIEEIRQAEATEKTEETSGR